MTVYELAEYNKEIRVMVTPADQEVKIQLSVSLESKNVPWFHLVN